MPKKIQQWIKRITDSEMPVFSRTAQEIISVSQGDETSAAQLSKVVLKDAAMTSRILKLANSVYYKRSDQQFSTISRAIMLLGFDTVRSMCLTIALIDGLEHGTNRKYLINEMARSLHAATQARIIAIERNDESPEEVYISTLLYHVGDLAFWCFCNDQESEKMDSALQQPDISPTQAQREVLGFSLKELGTTLARAWSLSNLLQNALEKPVSQNERAQSIILSQQLASACEKSWHSDKTLTITKKISALTGSKLEHITQKLHDGARQAAEDSTHYGAKSIASNIPLPSQDDKPGNNNDNPHQDLHHYPQPDSDQQLLILRELTRLTAQSGQLNIVMETVLDGLHNGVGLDRALFALVTPDRQSLSSKYALGDNNGILNRKFSFNLANPYANILKLCMKKQQPLWLNPDSDTVLTEKLSDKLIEITGTQHFFIAPIIVSNKTIGLYYADRQPSKRPLDQESFDNFQFFTQQSNLVLNHLRKQ